LEAIKLNDDLYQMLIQTRWEDNDKLGYLDNIVYNRFIEAAVARSTAFELGIDWLTDACYPASVEIECHHIRQLAWSETVDASLRVVRLGNSSVIYEIGLFEEHEASPAVARCFVQFFIGRHSQRLKSVSCVFISRLKAYSVPTKWCVRVQERPGRTQCSRH